MPSTIVIGTEIRLQATFKDPDGTATTPGTAPRIVITTPGGTRTTYTSGTSPAFSATTNTGEYEIQYTPTESGRYRYYPYVPTTDGNPVADESYFTVKDARGYPAPST